jgi:guanylate kinase
MKRLSEMLVVVGPSGSGKSTLITRLMKEFPQCFGYSVSHTTRGKREGEVDGVNYHFTGAEQFAALIDEGKFIEHAIVHDTMYGTSIQSVENVHQKNQICVMDLDIVGAENLRKHPTLQSIVVFVEPPSMAELEKRLRGRGTETEDRILKRLRSAEKEMEWFNKNKEFFDGIFVNDDVEQCYKLFRERVMSKCFEVPAVHAR